MIKWHLIIYQIHNSQNGKQNLVNLSLKEIVNLKMNQITAHINMTFKLTNKTKLIKNQHNKQSNNNNLLNQQQNQQKVA